MARTTEQPVALLPEHGVGQHRLSWVKLHDYLAKHGSVNIPEPPPGEAPDLNELALKMAQVQNARTKLDHLLTILEMRLAERKRQLDIQTEIYRQEKAQLMQDGSVKGSNARDRQANVDTLTGTNAATIALLKASKHDFEGALRAVASRLDTLELGKQVLNSMKALALAPLGRADEFSPSPQQENRPWRRTTGRSS